MKVLVTGVTGYLGGHVVRELAARGHSVLGVDSHERTVLGHGVGSVRTVGAVVAMGWYSTVGNGQPVLQRESLARTLRLLERVPTGTPLVFVSSAAVYGDRPDGVPAVETDTEAGEGSGPNCEYGRAKLKAEQAVRYYFPDSHVILRPGSLMGLGVPGGRTKTDTVVNAFAALGAARRPIEVWGPDAVKPVVAVSDLAVLIARIVSEYGGGPGRGTRPGLRSGKGEWPNGTYNVAEGSYAAREVATVAARVHRAEVVIVPSRLGSKSCRLSTRKLRATFPAPTPTTLQDAIKQFKGFRPSPSDRNVPWEDVPAEAAPRPRHV